GRRDEGGRRPYRVPADVYRPAAIQQLETLGRQIEIPVHAASPGADPVSLARSGVAAARSQGADTVLIDTAGRQTVDDELMSELERMRAAIDARQILLVAGALTGPGGGAAGQGVLPRLPPSGGRP